MSVLDFYVTVHSHHPSYSIGRITAVCSDPYIYIYTSEYLNSQKPVFPTNYLNIFPQVNPRVFRLCAVHLVSTVLVPLAATTKLSIFNFLKELVNEECGSL